MAVKNLKSLVLRGVAVLCDGRAVKVRRGFGSLATEHLGTISTLPMRPGCANPEPEPRTPAYPTANAGQVDNASALRAGRSVGTARGSVSRSGTASGSFASSWPVSAGGSPVSRSRAISAPPSAGSHLPLQPLARLAVHTGRPWQQRVGLGQES